MGGLSQLGGDLFHPGVGLVLLLGILALNVYKPRGLTPYGWRKQQAELQRRQHAAGRPVPRPPGELGAVS